MTAILSGNGAKSRPIGRWAHRLSVLIHRALSVGPPVEPVEVPWERVAAVSGHVRLRFEGWELGLDAINRAATERYIGRIPGANT